MHCTNMNPNDVLPFFVITFVAMALLLSLVVLLVKTWINCMIFHKAGYGWAWGLLTLVPIANIILPFVLALGDWPVRKELRRLKDAAKTQAT
ncbi:MAG: hypothetical protein ABSB11_08625 [Sedimentisphaerales bacterium]|jgi:hypothetical protein